MHWVTNVPDWDAWWRNRHRTEEAHSLDLFSPNWKLLYSIEGDAFDALGIEDIKAVDEEGNLIVELSGSEPRIGKIRVSIGRE